MRQYNIPTLAQVMACRLIGTNPLSEPMLPYCQLDPEEHILMKFDSNSKVYIQEKCAVSTFICVDVYELIKQKW